MRVRLIGTIALALFFISAFVSDYTSAQFPGGKEAMGKFIRDSLRYPEKERAKGKEALVSVSFTIAKTGQVVNPSTALVVGESNNFRIEAERLVLSMPKWEPATDRRGKPTEDWGYVMIKFELPDSLVDLPEPSEDTTLFVKAEDVDSVPEFPGDGVGMQRYLQNIIRYPQMEREQGKDGTVYIAYTIEKNGKVSNVYAHKEVPGAPGLTREAKRVVSSFPRHKPAMKNGKAVRYRYVVPVKFVLQ